MKEDQYICKKLNSSINLACFIFVIYKSQFVSINGFENRLISEKAIFFL